MYSPLEVYLVLFINAALYSLSCMACTARSHGVRQAIKDVERVFVV